MTGSINRQRGSVRPRSACTPANINEVEGLALSQEDKPQTQFTTENCATKSHLVCEVVGIFRWDMVCFGLFLEDGISGDENQGQYWIIFLQNYILTPVWAGSSQSKHLGFVQAGLLESGWEGYAGSRMIFMPFVVCWTDAALWASGKNQSDSSPGSWSDVVSQSSDFVSVPNTVVCHSCTFVGFVWASK